MEEIIKRIEELKMQIEDIQKVYKIELEREKNEKNDPIQANRKNKIDKLQAELKIAEINKEEKMKEIKIKEIEKQMPLPRAPKFICSTTVSRPWTTRPTWPCAGL